MTTMQDLLKLQESIQDASVPRDTLKELIRVAIDNYQDDKAEMAIKSLSYSESLTLAHIYPEGNIEEKKLFLASKLSEEIGITRSVIVNALRKAEALGLIRTQSLGLKGTYITVTDIATFTHVIQKLRESLPELPANM